ncbi:MAG: serine/threonine protein kinase, partial [Planctomycetes bacterium]|nr:serine/threonine protein kinase [Planctomycetota bacterium]
EQGGEELVQPQQCDHDRNIPKSLGEYRILRELGRGGMGTVYEAEHMMMHRRAALKVLSPAFAGQEIHRKRFYQEARLA